MHCLLLVAILVTCASCQVDVENSITTFIEKEWALFKKLYEREYSALEESFRKKIYVNNLKMIHEHNKDAKTGKHTYTLGMNEYGDMLHHEFISVMNGFKKDYNQTRRYTGSYMLTGFNVELPKSVDWRTKGAVTPIKNQGACGSCWSFSTTGSLEGAHFLKTGKLVSLSEQNLVDCSTSYGNDGCNGGLMDQAFQYVKDNGGIDTEEAYPYEGEDDKCRFTKKDIGATDTGFVDVTPHEDEHALKKAVATVGPVSVAIDASSRSFQFYKHGVYNDKECQQESLDHGVLTVGYGTDEETGEDYWIVKNSWGLTWGKDGYILMARNHNNQCGIATQASYPLV